MSHIPSSSSISYRKTDYALLAVLTVAVYARALGHEFQMSWDDNWYLVYNSSVQGFSWNNIKSIFTSIYQANYAPLQMLSYILDYSLWGLDPTGYIATNISIHILNGLLLYRLLFRLHCERVVALVAAALFLVHPLQVESVAWISCRKNVLSLFFFLISWEAYRQYRFSEPGQGRLQYLTSLTAFLLSLMSKSTTLILPLILILYDICFPSGVRRHLIKDKLPYFAVSFVFALLSMHFQNTDFQGGIRTAYHGGTPLTTLYTMLPVFCSYLARLVWPAGLSAVYAPPVYTSMNSAVAASALILAAVAWGGIRLIRTDRRAGFWIPFFWIGLLPFAQIVPIEWLISDRYINVSIIAPSALAGVALLHVRTRTSVTGTRILYCSVTIWIIALSVTSFQRVGIWKNSLTLWSDTVAKQPNSSKAWVCYGESLQSSGQVDAAINAYERGLAIAPDNPEVLAALGNLYTSENKLDKGLPLLQKLLHKYPSHVIGLAALGTNYLKRGNLGEAEKAYKRAHDLQPESWQVMTLLGNLALAQGNLDLARHNYNQVESRGYNYQVVAYQLACVESMAGRMDLALIWLEKAFQRGFRDYNKLHEEQYLSALTRDPGFNHLIQQYFQ